MSALDYRPDGAELALAEAFNRRTLRIHLLGAPDYAPRRVLAAAPEPDWPIRHNGKADGVVSVHYADGGTTLIAATRSGWVHVWNLAADGERPARSWRASPERLAAARVTAEGVFTLSGRKLRRWSPAGAPLAEWAVPGDRPVHDGLARAADGAIWAGTDEALHGLDPTTLAPARPPVRAVGGAFAAHPGEPLLFRSQGPERVAVLDQATGREVRALRAPPADALGQGAFDLAADPSGRLLCRTDAGAGRLQVWDLLDGRLALALPVVRDGTYGRLAFAGGGVAVSVAGGAARLDPPAAPPLPAWLLPAPLWDAAAAPDGRTVAAYGATGETKTVARSFTTDGASPVAPRDLDAPIDERPGGLALADAPDAWWYVARDTARLTRGPGRAVLGALDRRGGVLAAPGGATVAHTDGEVLEVGPGGGTRVAFAVPLERRRAGVTVAAVAAARGLTAVALRDGTLFLLRPGATPECVRVSTGDRPLCLALPADGRAAVVGLESGEWARVDTASAVVVQRERGHAAAVTAVALTHAGEILSGAADGTLRLTRPDGRPLCTLRRASQVQRLLVSGDGTTVIGFCRGDFGLFRLPLALLRGEPGA